MSKKFKTFVDTALTFVEEVEPDKITDKNLEMYIQKQYLRADDYSAFVILEGITTNKSRVHFGNTQQGIHGLIKKVTVKNKKIPLLSENAFRGMLNHQLRVLSKRVKLGESTCGVFDERAKKKWECGHCFKCGIMGYLRTVKKGKGISHNAVHRLGVRSFLPIGSTEIITEFHNSLDAAKGTIFYTKNAGDDAAANIYTLEYIGPGSKFPLQLTMRGMAPAEIGVSLISARLAWSVLGLGRHKGGAFTTWDDNTDEWELRYIEIDKEEELYNGTELKEIIGTLKRVGYIALGKRLFRNYNLAEIERPKKKQKNK